jgi:hypothetical protein
VRRVCRSTAEALLTPHHCSTSHTVRYRAGSVQSRPACQCQQDNSVNRLRVRLTERGPPTFSNSRSDRKLDVSVLRPIGGRGCAPLVVSLFSFTTAAAALLAGPCRMKLTHAGALFLNKVLGPRFPLGEFGLHKDVTEYGNRVVSHIDIVGWQRKLPSLLGY